MLPFGLFSQDSLHTQRPVASLPSQHRVESLSLHHGRLMARRPQRCSELLAGWEVLGVPR